MIKTIPGARFIADTKLWFVPADQHAALEAAVERGKTHAEARAKEAYAAAQLEQQRQQAAAQAKARAQAEADKAAGILRDVYFQTPADFDGLPKPGSLADKKGAIYRLVSQTRGRYWRPDDEPMSFGRMGERGQDWHLVWQLADEADTARFRAAQTEAAAKRAAARVVKDLANDVEWSGTLPGGTNVLDGERLLDTQNAYGGGDWWVIQPDKIWYVRNNGMDGDNWARNNVQTGGAGAIGRYVPYTDKLAQQLRSADALLNPKARAA